MIAGNIIYYRKKPRSPADTSAVGFPYNAGNTENPMTLTDAQVELYRHAKRWTRAEFAKLDELFPDQLCELIEGHLINKMGQSPPHAHVIQLLTTILSVAFPYQVRIQSPITLPDPEGFRSEPQPDAVVLNKSFREIPGHPRPEDIALIIEVSDTTLALDLTTKARLYSRCGIPEYWVVDVLQQQVMVFREPGPGDGGYGLRNVYGADDTISTIDGKFQLQVHGLFA
jgi:Uma2 family endonuclease